MATVAEELAIAVAHHQAGRVDEAEQIYRQILAVEPNQPDAWHLLGVAANERGQSAQALEYIGRSLQLKPHSPEAHSNLGNAFKVQGRLSEAIESYRQALNWNPNFGDAHYNLGNALFEQSNFDQAIAHFQRAAELLPDMARVWHNLGVTLAALGDLDAAGTAYRRAIELQPALFDAHNNLGTVYYEQSRLDEAAACYRKALELYADFAEAHFNLAIVLGDQGRFDDALAAHARAIAIKPDYIDAHWNRSLLWLRWGDFHRGFAEYEWRWRCKDAVIRSFPAPAWDGSALPGKTILIHAEQGLGDTIQFVRFLPRIRELGGRIVLEVQRPLLNLLANFPGVDQLIARGDELPPFDVYAPLLSLPRILNTSLGTIPRTTPYLSADSSLAAKWRERLSSVSGFRIGINWRGRGGKGSYRVRDVPLECFAPLARVPGVQLICLQKGEGREEMAAFAEHGQLVDLGADIDESAGAFMDTAAIMSNLDLVITSDTSIPHLAGALGVPVWLVLPFASDWRWLIDRQDSPWYPTMRLFRQPRAGDWRSVFSEVKSALLDLVRGSEFANS